MKNIIILLGFLALFVTHIFAIDGCDLPDSPNTSYLHLTDDGSVLYKSIYDIGGFQFKIDPIGNCSDEQFDARRQHRAKSSS